MSTNRYTVPVRQQIDVLLWNSLEEERSHLQFVTMILLKVDYHLVEVPRIWESCRIGISVVAAPCNTMKKKKKEATSAHVPVL